MGVRDRIMRWLSRGEIDPIDPDKIVEVAEVRLFEGPLLVTALRRADIEAHGVEAWDFVTKSHTRMRILVRAEDAPAALELIRESSARLQHPNP